MLCPPKKVQETDLRETSVCVRWPKKYKYLTFGACGVFGFWKNLVISAFCALIR